MCAGSYRRNRPGHRAGAAQPGITGVSHGGVDLTAVPSAPTGESWYYGLGMPLQLDATTVGLLANIRRDGTPYRRLRSRHRPRDVRPPKQRQYQPTRPVSRPTSENNPITGVPSITAKFPVMGGFVPLGGRFAANGSSHPYGGTGFGMSEVEFYPANFSLPLPTGNQPRPPIGGAAVQLQWQSVCGHYSRGACNNGRLAARAGGSSRRACRLPSPTATTC